MNLSMISQETWHTRTEKNDYQAQNIFKQYKWWIGFFTLSCTDSKLVNVAGCSSASPVYLPHSLENKSMPSVNAQCRAFAKWLGGKALRFANTEKKICCECQRGELRAKGKIKIIYARRKILPAFTKYLFLFFSILFWRLYYNTHRNTVPVPLPSATPTWGKINRRKYCWE